VLTLWLSLALTYHLPAQDEPEDPPAAEETPVVATPEPTPSGDSVFGGDEEPAKKPKKKKKDKKTKTNKDNKGAELGYFSSYAPDNTNVYVEISDPKLLWEVMDDSLVGDLVKHKGFSSFLDRVTWDELEVGEIEPLSPFDFKAGELLPFVDGSVAYINSSYQPMAEMNLEGEQSTSAATTHFDAILVFQCDQKQKDKLKDLLDQKFSEGMEDVRTSRETIGGAQVTTIRSTKKETGFVPDSTSRNPNYVETTVSYSLIYEYAFVDDVVLLGEGSNLPITKMLQKRSKSKPETLAKSDRFRQYMGDLLDGDKAPENFILGYADLAYQRHLTEYYATLSKDEQAVANMDRTDLSPAIKGFAALMIAQKGSISFRGVVEGADDIPYFDEIVEFVEPVDRDLLSIFGETTKNGGLFGLDLGGLVKWTVAKLKDQPEYNGYVEYGRQSVQTEFGFDIFEDFLFKLGSQHASWSFESSAKQPTMPAMAERGAWEQNVFGLGFTDTPGLEALIKRIIPKLQEMAPGQFHVNEQRFDSATIFVVQDKPTDADITIVLAPTGDFLLLGGSLDQMKQAISSIRSPSSEGLAGRRSLERTLKTAPDSSFSLGLSRDFELEPAFAREAQYGLFMGQAEEWGVLEDDVATSVWDTDEVQVKEPIPLRTDAVSWFHLDGTKLSGRLDFIRIEADKK